MATPVPTPSSPLHIPLPTVSHPGVAAAAFVLLLIGTSGALWWRVRREYIRRTDETLRRLYPPDDDA